MSNASWRPTATKAALEARALLYHKIRYFFDNRGVLEVETPQLAACGVTDINIDCLPVEGYGYLQSSPEYHMKRLLAAGVGPIWQLTKVFRQDEAGKHHNPEFSLLEWYRPGFSLPQLIAETLELLQLSLSSRPIKEDTFREAFKKVTSLDPLDCDEAALAARARLSGIDLPDMSSAQWIDWLMAAEVEPSFDPNALTVITDFPPWSASLAKIRRDAQGDEVACRFEIYSGGLELANGYDELCDARVQRERFLEDQIWRQQSGKAVPPLDEQLLTALKEGLPPVSGVALGIDRLLMLQLGANRIDQVLSFPHSSA